MHDDSASTVCPNCPCPRNGKQMLLPLTNHLEEGCGAPRDMEYHSIPPLPMVQAKILLSWKGGPLTGGP